MKKLLFILIALFVCTGRADNVITSKEYVDTAGVALQPQISAKNTNTVLTYPATGTSTPGEKAIYDASAAYTTQTDALVTAGQFNNALQVALDTEFVCVSRNDQGCLLYEIRAATQKQILPAGYTRLEYIESTGTQSINTGKKLHGTDTIEIKYSDFIKGSSSDNMLFGHYSDNAIAYNLMLNRIYVYFKSLVGVPISSIDTSDTSAHTIKLGNNKLYFDNELKIKFNRETDFQTSGPVYLFSANNSYKSTAKIYFYKVTSFDNQIIQNLIPARRDSDGEIGMYDLVSGTFFTNADSGKFVAGPVVGSNLYLPSGN